MFEITTPLPANIDAEKMVLGSVMIQEEAMHAFRTVIVLDDFSMEKHRRIWAAMCAVYDRGAKVDRVTAADELITLGQLESIDGLSYLVSLDDGLPVIPNLDSYIRILKDKAMLRRIAHAAFHLMNRALAAEESPDAIVNSLGQTILDLSPKDERRGFVSPAELIERRGINELLAPRREQGIILPWSSLNLALCGLHTEQMVLLAGHTSCGKTSAALQIAATAAQQGVGVAIFSLEMSTESLFRRMVYQMGRVDAERHRHDKLTREEMQSIREAAAELRDLPVYWNDTASCTVPAIHAELRKLRMRANVGLVIVDFLQIVRGTGRVENRNNEVGGNSRGLKMAAKEFGIPFLVLSQLSRGNKNDAPDRKPSLRDIRDSGEVEENSDVVVFVHQVPSVYAPVREAEFIVAKQREGPRDISLPMVFRTDCQRFEVVEDQR